MNGLAGGAKSLLRIVAALLFLQHGGQKLLGWFGGLPGGHLDPLLRVAGCIELIGGALLLVGRVPRVGRDGGGLLQGALPAGRVADRESRRVAGALLLPLALLRRGRTGTVGLLCKL